uniref:ShKT domain-containing protein n=1 Tax=Chrysotila carterae TaxID=13221 RepID=A0A7S4EX92_CHRCT
MTFESAFGLAGNTCKEGKCEDKNATACAIWALRDECLFNPQHMFQECPASCGVCSTVCEDKSTDCQNWAEDGQCEVNPDGMLTMCPQSCGVCQQLEQFYHNGIGGDKDEL